VVIFQLGRAELNCFFEGNKTAYIDCFSIPFVGWSENGGLDRLDYYSPMTSLIPESLAKETAEKNHFLAKKVQYKRSWPSKCQ
jgi:hypothetical protein